MNLEEEFLLLKVFYNFESLYLNTKCPIFDHCYYSELEAYNLFMAVFIDLWLYLVTTTQLSYAVQQGVTLTHK